MSKKKDRLLEIQEELISLEHLLVDIYEAKRKRDLLFRKIINDLGKLVRKNYWKEYEEWKTEMITTHGVLEPETSMDWLRSMFQQIAKKLK
jgi:hypothetical protein